MMSMINTMPGMQPGNIQFAASARQKAAAEPVSEAKFSGATRKEDPALVTVSGNGTVERMPDTMRLSVTLQEQGKTKGEVNEALNTKSEKLVQALKALNLPETVKRESRFSQVYPIYDYSGNRRKPTVTGYQGSFSVSVVERGGKHDEFPTHAAAIKDVADSFDTATFAGPSYDISNREEAGLEALQKAVADARKKAEAIARQLGFELEEKPASVEVGSDPYASNRGFRASASLESAAFAADGGGASAESFEIAPIQVGSEGVKVQFKIKN